MQNINAYIGFNGKCHEAMTFYKDCIGGELTFMPVKGSPIEAQCPPTMKDQILHSTLAVNGSLLMGSDMVGPGGYIKGNDMALSVSCSSEEEINSFYLKLGEGGKIIDPLKMQFWGAMFGVVEDKFGVRWMFNYDKNQK